MQRPFETALADADAVAVAAIELARQLGRIHNDAELADLAGSTTATQEALDEADDEWQSALNAADTAVTAILDVPVASLAQLATRSDTYLRRCADLLAPKSERETRYDGDLQRFLHDEERRRLLNSTLAAIAAISNPPPPPQTPFAAAFARVQEATAANVAATEAYQAADAAVDAEAPIPEILRISEHQWFFTEEAINREAGLSIDEKAQKLAALRAYLPARDAARQRHNYDAASAADDDTCDAMRSAMYDALDVPVATLEELQQKFWIYLDLFAADYQGETPDAPEMFSRMLSGPSDEAGLARLYQDVLRLTGASSAVLDAERFDARAWIEDVERLPGAVVDRCGVGVMEDHDGKVNKEPFARQRALLRWQRKLVLLAAEERDEERRNSPTAAADADAMHKARRAISPTPFKVAREMTRAEMEAA